MKPVWTTEEVRAAADGDLETLRNLLTRRQLLGGMALGAGALALGPFIPSTARAAVGGNLNLMTWEGYDLHNELKDWRDKNSVKVNLSTITMQDDVQAKFIGGSPVPIDLTEYNQGYDRLYADELKIIRPVEVDKVPNYNKRDIFPGFYQTERWYRDGVQWGIPWVWGLNSLVYNPALMDKPTSYRDLLDPKLNGKICIIDEVTGTWPIAAVLAGYGDVYPNLTPEQLAESFDVLREFRAASKTFAASNGDLVSLFASGEVVACLNCWSGITVETAKQGVETAYTVPKEGAIMWSDAWFTPAVAKNIDTAHAFMNESLTPAAQASIAKTAVAGCVNKNAVALMDEQTRSLFDYDNLDSVFKSAPLFGIPPRQSDQFATYDDWVKAYEDLKAGL